MLTLIDKINSRKDLTKKYIFQTEDNLIIEIAYINKNNGKDILCVPSQTSCAMKCRFCHMADISDKLINRNLLPEEIKEGVDFVYDDLSLKDMRNVLLISYMGCGEPLFNYKNVVKSMIYIRDGYRERVPIVRFAIATSMPEGVWLNFFDMTNEIKKNDLLVKIHLSLHYTNDVLRKEWMPYSLPVKQSISALEYYNLLTGNSVEIHYALIDNLNDSETEAKCLAELLNNRNIPVKFLFYNEKDTIDFHASPTEKLEIFGKHLDSCGITHEYYIPPGLDIGASCGQFLMDYYLKYNTKI
jgi:23S rRNA (adenine2503-C2)-methyltransferase